MICEQVNTAVHINYSNNTIETPSNQKRFNHSKNDKDYSKQQS